MNEQRQTYGDLFDPPAVKKEKKDDCEKGT